MSLYEFQNYNKHGNVRTRLIPWPTGKAFGINPNGFGGYIGVRKFKYKYKHEFMPPGLIVLNNQKYIVPGWHPVLMETELNDIKWVKPKVKKTEVIKHKFGSSSSDKVYIAKEYVSADGSRKYTCNCPGSWMAKNKTQGCKHQQELMSRVVEN
jgi:hypothetical protein